MTEIKKRDALKHQLKDKRETMCGIGTRKLKLFLNKKIREGDILAGIFRTALEAEDANINAKKYFGDYSERYYAVKENMIGQLIGLCRACGITSYGYQNNDSPFPKHIMYFDLPGCEQISFHCTVKSEWAVPKYSGSWDGQTVSTLPKLERAINNRYGLEICSQYGLSLSDNHIGGRLAC